MRICLTLATPLRGSNYYDPHFLGQEIEIKVDVNDLAQNHIFHKWYVCIWNPRISLKKHTNILKAHTKVLKTSKIWNTDDELL